MSGRGITVWNNIYQVIYLILKLISNIKYIINSKRKIKRNKIKSILIMGNGPSLKYTDIDKVINNGAEVICVNFFPCKDNRFFSIKPKYLCLLDPSFYRTTGEISLEKQKKELWETIGQVDWKMSIIGYWGNRIPVNNPKIDYIGLNTIPYTCSFLKKFLYTNNLANFGFQNVVLGALYYAVVSGIKEIYLAGVDNSEFTNLEVDEKNEAYVRYEHFYGVDRGRCFGIKKGEFYLRMADYQRTFEQYYNASEYVKKYTDAVIVNLNPYSYVDVFEKTKDYYCGEYR